MDQSYASCRVLRPPSCLTAGFLSTEPKLAEANRVSLLRAKRPKQVRSCTCSHEKPSFGSPRGWHNKASASRSNKRAAAGDSGAQTSERKEEKASEEEEGISDADVQASMSAAAGLLGADDTSSSWSMKDELPGLTDEPVYVLKQEKPKPKRPGEVIFELLFLLGGMLDRPFEGGGQAMEAAAEVVIERVEEELRRARGEGVEEEKLTEVGRYVHLLSVDVKMLGAARKHETLVTRCATAQERVKGALKRAELLDKTP